MTEGNEDETEIGDTPDRCSQSDQGHTPGNQVSCEGAKRDRYKCFIAVCYVGGNDLNAALVRAGWAVAYRRYSMDYVGKEEAARSEGVGLRVLV